MKLASLALALIVAASPLPSFAQDVTTSADEQVLIKQIQTNRRGVYADYLKLTDAESKAFWPIYDEYEAKSKVLVDQYVAMVNKFADEYDTLTDAQASEILKERTTIERNRLDLKIKYTDRIAKALPGTKALRYAQLESRIENLTQRNIYTLIPLAR
jgi:hypothetical protein